MNANQTSSDGDFSHLLDRLACGELDQTARGELLAWLEADPRRWRQCGLAFLEAQNWSEALSAWPAAGENARGTVRATRLPPSSPIARRALYGAALAACLLVAFGLGLAASRSFLAPESKAARAMASDSAHPAPRHQANQQLDAVNPSDRPRVAVARPAIDIPDYVRRQWERRGYELSVERRYLFGRLPDGEPIVLPVERIQAQFVGSKIY
jgi:hypothetical protein